MVESIKNQINPAEKNLIPNTEHAVYDKTTTNETYLHVANKHNVEVNRLKWACYKYGQVQTESQSKCPQDIIKPQKRVGRPCILTFEEETKIYETTKYFADMCTPLTRNDLCDLLQETIKLLPMSRQQQIKFKDNRSSHKWVTKFLIRHPDLAPKSMKCVESKHVTAITKHNIGTHIARINAVVNRYNIRDSNRIFNLDDCGISFSKMARRSLRKGIGYKAKNLVTTAVDSKGNLDHVTVMAVVIASGKAYKPVIAFPGKQAHYRNIEGTTQTLQDVLPDCYLFQRPIAGVDSQIYLSWASKFLIETENLRSEARFLMLIVDGY